jgi:anti-sigma factor RsiW
MMINRHNYEEFFLLYVDDELTPVQKRLVDAFVAMNPDLQEEFRIIQETKLNFDAVLDDQFKAGLLKPLNEDTILREEQLLLYIDNELKAEDRMKIEEAAAKDYTLQKELQLLKQTVLQADATIVFPDKSLLYKEAQPARVFSIGTAAKRWSAAAAVFLLMGSAVWFAVNNQQPVDGPVVKNPTTTQKKKTSTVEPVQPIEPIVEQPLVQQSTTVQQPAVQKNATQSNTTTAPATIKQNNNTIAQSNTNKKQDLPVVQQQKDEEIIAVVQPPTIKPENISVTNSNKTTPPSVQLIASTTSSTIIDNDNSDGADETDERFFNEERQRKSGLKSFAKKAKRLFERTTGIKSDDSEVRFAVFAVNTQ